MKKIKIFIILVIFIIVNTTISNAVSLTIKSSKTTANKGDSVSITVNGSGISGRVNLSVTGNASLSDSSVWLDNSSAKTTLKINGTGNIVVTATPSDISNSTTGDAITNIKSVSTTINVKSTSSDSSSNTINNNASKPSTDATLKNLGIKPNDFSGFRKATTSYSVSVPKNVDKVSIYATPSNSKATVTGTGSKNLQIGKNTFNIKVTAEDKKTTKTYTLTITRKEEETPVSDATLTNLGIRPKEYDFTGFKPSVTTYNVSVSNDVEKITIYATAKNNKDTITGTGSKNIKVGQNKCEIKVTSEDKKKTKTYVINVTRKEKEEEPEEKLNEDDEERNENNEADTLIQGLKNISIKNYNLSPSFSQDTYSYKVDVNELVDKLEIDTESTSDDIEVEIAGNENLKQGENIITILVHNKKDDSTSTYQITANIENQEAKLTTENKELENAKSNSNLKEWIIKGVMLGIIILIIVFLIKRHKLNKEYDEYDEDEEDDADEDADEDYNYEDEDDSEDESEFNEGRRNMYSDRPNANLYNPNSEYKSTASEEIRNIGLFDNTQKNEFEEDDRHKRNRKYKGRRFK